MRTLRTAAAYALIALAGVLLIPLWLLALALSLPLHAAKAITDAEEEPWRP